MFQYITVMSRDSVAPSVRPIRASWVRMPPSTRGSVKLVSGIVSATMQTVVSCGGTRSPRGWAAADAARRSATERPMSPMLMVALMARVLYCTPVLW